MVLPAIAGAALQAPTTARAAVALVATIGAVASFVQGDTPETPALFRSADLRERLQAMLRRPPGRLACAAVLLGGGASTIAWARGHGGLAPYAVGDDHDDAWALLARGSSGLRIAYTGSNLPLPLWGPTLRNFVQYVNISRGPQARLQDFLPEAATVPMTLPVSAEPAPERARPDQGAWLANLASARIDTLFVAALYPDVRASMTHDGDGFPIERAWADVLPERFTLLFANPGARVYRVRPTGGGQDRTQDRTQDRAPR